MKKLAYIIFIYTLITVYSIEVFSQVGVTGDGSAPDPSAGLDVNFTDKGFLLPRLTTLQQVQISNPAIGLLIFNTDSLDFWYFTGIYWLSLRHVNDTIDPSDWICGLNLTYVDQIYSTVQIGSQCFFGGNLNIGLRINGSQAQSDNGTIEKYCYNDDESNCEIYGGLYLWDEMMQYSTSPGSQGICPTGWSIPTDEELCTLSTFIDPTVNCSTLDWSGTDAGLKMKSTSGWYSNGNGTDNYGFTLLPGAYRLYTGTYSDLGQYGVIWSSTEQSTSNAFIRNFAFNEDRIWRYGSYKTFGFSVRCIRDN